MDRYWGESGRRWKDVKRCDRECSYCLRVVRFMVTFLSVGKNAGLRTSDGRFSNLAIYYFTVEITAEGDMDLILKLHTPCTGQLTDTISWHHEQH